MKSLVVVLWMALLCLLHLCICLPHPGGNRIRSNLPILSSDLRKSSRLTDLSKIFKVRNLPPTLTDVTKDENEIDLLRKLKKNHKNVAKQNNQEMDECQNYREKQGRIERLHYKNNVHECFFINVQGEITVTFDSRIEIEDRGNNKCVNDYLEFTEQYDANNFLGKPSKVVCGSVAPKPFALHGPVMIDFFTDATQGGYGFALNWAPGNSVKGDGNGNGNGNGNKIAGCGVPKVATPRIAHGSRAHKGQYPWQISLIEHAANNFHVCGASLVSDKWAITAAHCFFNQEKTRFLYEKDIKLVLGEFDRTSQENTEKTVNVARIIIHEKFREEGLDTLIHDVALLELAERVEFTDYILPICIGKAPLPHGTSCHASGWGDTKDTGDDNFLNDVELFLVECSYHFYDESNICAKNGIKGACEGDSGGPLACMKNGAYYLQGTASFLMGDCGKKNTYFVNIPHYYPWIQEKSGGEL